MSERWVCRYCIATIGLKGSDLKNWPSPDDEEAIVTHVESVHNMPVRREGETEAQTRQRFYQQYPKARNPETCKCPACHKQRGSPLADIFKIVKAITPSRELKISEVE